MNLKKKIIKTIKFIIVITLFFTINPISNLLINSLHISSNIYKLIIPIFVEIIYILIMFFMYKKSIIQEFKTVKKNKKDILTKGFTYWFYGLMIMCASNIVINWIIGNAPINETNIRTLLKEYPIYVCFSTVILAPIIEELVFRKSFRDIINNNWIYIFTSSFFFAILHITSSAETNPLYYLYLIPYASMGIAFSYMNTKTNTVFSSMTFHILHNALTMVTALAQIGVIL